MKRVGLLWKVIKRLHFEKILYGFVAWVLLTAVIIMFVEPGITKFGDAIWYVFVASTSIGFGDFVTVTFIGRLLTVLTTIYEIVIAAMFSGVVVSYYLELVRRKENEILSGYLDKLEHLTELSPEELKQIEDKVREMR